jgi:hypothetical protein
MISFCEKFRDEHVTLKVYLICLTGLGTKLHRILLALCGQRGFKYAIVEPANPATYHIYTKKLNGKEFTSVYLPTFVTNDGRKPFEHLDLEIQLIVFDLQ